MNTSVSKETIEKLCTCAGVFLIKNDPEPKVLLVESHRKSFQFSFPKGKRNKNEHTLQTAKRELYEETGLKESSYNIIPGKVYIEYRSDTGNPHIIYYLAELKDNDVTLCPIDTGEIKSADWYTGDDIYNMKGSFYFQRRQITTRALKEWKLSRTKRENVCSQFATPLH